jgi:2-polyprenyl-3-methyl-5-hydroxy-6-metoxy-1,4-benzoquinol methylase
LTTTTIETTSRKPTGLKRTCPVCGNSQRERCQRWYVIPEFEVLRCRDCSVTFVDQVVDDNFGFTVEYEIKTDPTITIKAANDFRRVKTKLQAFGLNEFSGPRLLDVGCGTGAFLEPAQRDGFRVVGLELSEPVAKYARERRGLDVRACSIEFPTDFPPESFEIITMFGVIEHLGDPRSATRECARLLRPQGFLVLQTPTEDGLIRRIGRWLYRATFGTVNFHVRQLFSMGGGHSVIFNRRSIKTLLSASGFEIYSVERSTYGLRVLLMRFDDYPFIKRLVHSVGTSIIFVLGHLLGGSNHMTVYARKRAAA